MRIIILLNQYKKRTKNKRYRIEKKEKKKKNKNTVKKMYKEVIDTQGDCSVKRTVLWQISTIQQGKYLYNLKRKQSIGVITSELGRKKKEILNLFI